MCVYLHIIEAQAVAIVKLFGQGDVKVVDIGKTWKEVVVEHNGDLKSGLVWISNGQKEVGLQMVWISNRNWYPEAQPFEIWINGPLFVKNHLKSGHKRSDFECSSFQMVWTIAIAIAKAWPFETHPKKVRISDGKTSDPHCSKMTEKYKQNSNYHAKLTSSGY